MGARRAATEEIEITPEMIKAGISAWESSAGDEFPRHALDHHLTVAAIYRAMAEAAQ